MLIQLPLAAVLLLGVAAPAAANSTVPPVNPNGVDSTSYGTDFRDGLNNMERYNQFNNNPINRGANRIRNGITDTMDDNRIDGTNRMNGTYRARATTNNNTMNWSWLGLLGLFGLAGMFKGSSRDSRS